MPKQPNPVPEGNPGKRNIMEKQKTITDKWGEELTATILALVPKGEYFKRKPDSVKIHIRDEYCRTAKKYQCDDTDDAWGNGILLKGSTVVYTGFTY